MATRYPHSRVYLLVILMLGLLWVLLGCRSMIDQAVDRAVDRVYVILDERAAEIADVPPADPPGPDASWQKWVVYVGGLIGAGATGTWLWARRRPTKEDDDE